MRVMKASLLRYAAAAKASPYRAMFATLAKVAGANEDKFARASWIEGVMGFSPGAITGSEDQWFSEIRADLQSGAVNKVVDVLRHNHGMEDGDIALMVSNRDTGMFDELFKGINSVTRGQPVRGHDTNALAFSLAAGISPLTGQPLRQYGGAGKGVFYWIGSYAPKRVWLKGIKTIVFKEAKNRALDIVRKSKAQILDTTRSIDAPVESDTGDPMTLADIIQGESAVERADFVDLAAAIYQDPWVMGIIDNEVKKNLTSPQQQLVWDAIRQNPEVLKIEPDKVGVEARALGQIVADMKGEEYVRNQTDKAVGKLFRTKVWPAMAGALEDSDIAKRLLKNRHIMEILQEATRRIGPGKEHMGPIYPAGEAPPSARERRQMEKQRHGPFSIDPSTPVEGPRTTEYPDWLKKLRSDPDLRALARLASDKAHAAFIRKAAAKVAALWWMKSAYRLPPDQRKLYQKGKRWAENNFETFVFETPKGMRFNTDGLAYGIARHLGHPDMKDDPTHWVYEIAYDIERAARRQGLSKIKGRTVIR